MQGMGLKSLMKNPALIPLYVCTLAGAAGAIFYTIRLATRSPEVTWSRTNNPEPWEAYRSAQHKFYSPIRDYSKTESQAPKY
ncbi:unnamed protein product [Hermetia illucens]|uniref:Uncharacterized protein n=1 Tax=Hermetia illucens TaxID=343691 RepID=A0A7R8YUH8_HERIL|nr:cytochrome c oxidase subunit NDUFA4 [Hermetia illucens]CAD7084751.1 unnamed protein product [Hermetia illucens]